MNKIYRLVWNARKHCWMAAAEIARSSGPRAASVRSAAVLSLLGGSLLAQAATPQPSVTPTGSNTRSYVAANGATVVDIATANAAGVSSNQYTQYNVNSKGLVLNNGNTSQLARQSQLAGQVYANVNLSSQASLILNQVVSTGRSTLAGFTEVLGGKADVVVANPNGITCSGCGFINTDRVTLSTGLPVFGGNGSLAGFNVSQGDIQINGSGINASTQQILDLVSRSVSISGQVNVPDFGVYAGPNRWDYASRRVTATVAPSGSAPSYAIDTAALGGMYANRIFLVSTEAGVGVRMAGNAAANSGDFTLTSAGSIQLSNQLSAAGNVAIGATGNASTLQLSDASVSAGQDLTLSSQASSSLIGGTLYAGHDLTLQAAALSDSADANAQRNNNQRFAIHDLNLSVAGSGTLDGSQWGSGGNWQASFSNLAIGSQGATLYSGQGLQLSSSSGDLALGKAQLKTAGDITLQAAGLISTRFDAAQGIESTSGNLSVTAAGGLDNTGSMSADAGNITLRAGNGSHNSGTLFAAGSLDIADAAGHGSASFSNDGTVQANGNLLLQASSASNSASGWVQAAGYSNLQLASLNNDGTWLLSTASNSTADSISLSGSLSDSGTLQSAHALNLSASSAGISGKLLAAGDLGVSTSGNYTTEQGSTTQSGGTLVLSAATLSNAGTLKANALNLTASNGFTNSGSSQADSGSALLRVDGTLNNSGTVYAAGNLDMADGSGHGSETFSNSGTMQANGNLLLQASSASNSASGWVQAAGYSNLQLASLNNDGTWLLSTASNSTADSISLSGSLSDSGTLQSAHALNLSASSAGISGKLLAAGDLGVSTSGNYTTEQGSTTQSGQVLNLQAAALDNVGMLRGSSLQVQARTGLRNGGSMLADAGNAVVRVDGTLNNSGTVYAAGNLDMADGSGHGSETFSNSGTIQANGNLLLQASNASNSASGWIQAAGYSNLQLASLNNDGSWLLSTTSNSQADTLSLQSPLSNNGNLQSAHAFNLNASSVDNRGKLLAVGNLGMSLNGTLVNESNASIQSAGSLTLSGVSQLDNGSGALLAGNQLVVSASTLNNSGTIQGGSAADSSLSINGSLNNNSGGLINMASQAAGGGTVAASTINNSATLQSYGGLSLELGSGGLNNNGLLLADQLLNISGQGGNRYNVTANGTIQGGSLNITADTLSLGRGQAVQSQGAMNLDLNSLSFADSAAHIVAARGGTSTGTLTLRDDLNNNAGIYSGGDLVVNAPSINVGTSGGMSALGKLTLNTRLDVTNSGALYAGDTLQLNSGAGGMINNVGTANGPLGTMRAGRQISLTAGIIDNNSIIESQGDIMLSAPIIHNDTYGGDTRYWGDPQSVALSSAYTSQGYNGCGCVDQTEWTDYTKTWTRQQYYANGATSLNSKPQIIGAGVVTLKNFDRVTNLAGVISAGTLNLQGNGGASFVNDDLALQKWGYAQTWQHYIKYIAAGPAKYIDDADYNDSGVYLARYYPAVYSSGAGIYAVNGINGNSFSLSNTSSAYSNPGSGNSPNLGSGTHLSSSAGSTAGSSAGSVSVGDKTTGNTATSVSTSHGSSGLAAGSVSLGQGVAPTGSISFGGLHISLPSNPNGYFVPVSQPGAHYLIETNPLMGAGNNATGSNYLLTLLGFNPDIAQTRLGDANYETYLIQQQLIAQTGNNLLKGYASQNAEIQKLMQNAASDAKTLGLTLGQAPTAQQLAGLKQDIVWMVSTTVAGQSVLVPQVFLAPATIASIQSGAVIASSNINLKLDALSNTGGTISGSKNLDISSKGDITNSSGTISGGNVNLASTNGNIINQTLTRSSGNAQNSTTEVGKQASIVATGDLSLTAAKDISNLGANISADGNASLTAKGNVTFDTLQNKTVTTTSQTTSTAFDKASTSSTVSTVKQIKSGLTVGGNLNMVAGKDITLAGTDASVGGNANLDAKGSVQLLDRTDTTSTHTVASQSGLGVGGGLFGTSVTTTDTSKGSSVSSSLKVKGDATLNAGTDITLRGSALDVAGSGALNASKVQVLAGESYETRQQQSNTTTFFKLTGTSSSGKAGADSGADSASSSSKGLAKASAGASASASASGQAAAGLALMSNTQTTSTDSSSNSVASSLRFGKGGSINAAQNIDIVGSTVKAGGDLQLNAQQVDIRAAENKSSHSSSSTETTLGLMTKVSADADASSKADASAQAKKTAIGTKAAASTSADANANGQANLTLLDITATKNDSSTLTHNGSAVSGGNVSINASKQLALTGSQLSADQDMQIKAGQVVVGTVKDVTTSSTQRTDVSIGLMGSSNNNANAGASVDTATVVNASAGASASASSANKLTLLKAVTGTDSSLDVVNQGSQIKAGGNLKLDAGKQLDVTGSGIAAGGNADLKADSQHFNAAQDVHQTSSSSNTTTAGLYLDASTGANASGKVMAETGASAMIGAGYYVNNSGSSSLKGSTTAVVSQLSAGGDMSRTASKDIVDTGTAISAGGNFRQTANTITSNAASDTSYGSSSQQNSEGRVGMYAGASASASVSGGAAADASVGGSISATHDDSQTANSASKARVSTIKVGGDFSSNSEQATSLEGSRISSGGNVNLKAGTLDYRAAQDTSSSSGTQANAAASLQVNVNAEHVVGGELSVAGGGGSNQLHSSSAVVGGISSGGNMSINVQKDASFAGTSLSGKGDINVTAGGKVNFAAANSTSQSSARDASASFSAGGSTGGGVDNKQTNGMVSAAANYNQSDSQSTSKTAATLQSGGAITVRSGGDMNLEGSKLASKGDATLAAGGQLTISAAHDTASTQKIGAGLSAGGSGGSSSDKGKETKEASASVGLSGEYGQSKQDSASVAALTSGGKLKLSAGQDIKLEGSALKAAESVTTQAGGSVIKQQAVSSSSGVDLAAGGTVTLKKKTTNDTAANDTGKTQTDRDKQAALAKEAAEVVNKKKTSATNSLSNAGNTISDAANQPENSLLDKAKNSKLGQAADKVITKGKELKDKIPVRVGDLQGGGSLQLENSSAVDVSISQGKDKPN